MLGGPQGTVSDLHRTLCVIPIGMSRKEKELVVKSKNNSSRREKITRFDFLTFTLNCR